jgi:dipeptidyl-peptidase-4
MKKLIFLMTLSLSVSLMAQKQITIEDFTTKNTFAQKSVNGINWMNDGKFYTSLAENKVVKFDITQGQAVETIADGNQLSEKITIDGYQMSADEKKLLLMTHFENIYRRSFKADYYLYDIDSKSLQKLSTGSKQSYATFSPDGTKIGFTRNNNLFYVTISDLKETQVTQDGKVNHIINGSTDWVYEEELGFAQAFYWSPDSQKMAFYRFDESNVKEYNMQKWNKGALYPEDYKFKYPKAGEDNSIVEIWILDVTTNQKVKADIGTERDIYIPRILWTTSSSTLSIQRMNRLQNTLEVLHADAATGKSSVILIEKSETYVDANYTTDEMMYLKNGKEFLFASERSGFKHLYLYNLKGTLIRPVTKGDWEVTQIVGVDEKTKTLYYISTEGNYLNRTFYSISLDGKKKAKLSQAEGSHTINMSNDFQFYIDYFNSATQPLTVSLFKTKGNELIKVLENNEELKKTIKEYAIVSKEYFKYTAADGSTEVDGFFLKPDDFNESQKYPVIVYQYSGPRSTNTTNSFGGGSFWWHQMLTQKGIIVAVVDTRGTGSRGEKFAKQTYKQLGKMETEDLIAAGKYLGSLPFVDKDRLAIWGWSFGGYTTSLVMTKGAGTYKVGIAGAPVTSWRYYDNIYTERFLQRPQENAAGYDENSPTKYADKLEGQFLLIHGTGDDNVHFQNSVALEDALISAGKQFRSHFYPDQPHGFRGGKVNHHRWTLMTDFLLDHL